MGRDLIPAHFKQDLFPTTLTSSARPQLLRNGEHNRSATRLHCELTHLGRRRYADFNKIPDQCMTGADQGCEGDLKCICRIDNHIGTNKLFSSDCLLKECSDGHGRRCKSLPVYIMAATDCHSVSERLAGVLSRVGQVRLG